MTTAATPDRNGAWKRERYKWKFCHGINFIVRTITIIHSKKKIIKLSCFMRYSWWTVYGFRITEATHDFKQLHAFKLLGKGSFRTRQYRRIWNVKNKHWKMKNIRLFRIIRRCNPKKNSWFTIQRKSNDKKTRFNGGMKCCVYIERVHKTAIFLFCQFFCIKPCRQCMSLVEQQMEATHRWQWNLLTMWHKSRKMEIM